MLDVFAGISLLHARVNKNLTHYIAFMTNGEKVSTRVGVAFVRRTKRDFLTALPAAMYLVLPLKTWTLPLVMRRFPYFISTVYVTEELLALKNSVIEKKRRAISKKTSNKLDAVSLARLVKLQGILNRGVATSHSELVEFGPFFRDHYSILDMGFGTLARCGRFLGIAFPWILPKTQLFRWASWCVTDNDLMRMEGVYKMSDFEVNEALEEQGFVALTAPADRQRSALMAHAKFTRSLAENFMRVKGLEVGLESQVTPEEVCGIATAMILARMLGAERFD
ncbi:hypothetical protein BC829DRAFT_414489 [Chytridium lagenaria]|nr:hypothetical protein BC829DRAFT_414489 [Chytridium lagenaria]